jgi:hypothetical protein
MKSDEKRSLGNCWQRYRDAFVTDDGPEMKKAYSAGFEARCDGKDGNHEMQAQDMSAATPAGSAWLAGFNDAKMAGFPSEEPEAAELEPS